MDLNLLTVFDMVMSERHVSRAAERLQMTQSAVSNALNRLRTRFDDRLFVKAARGVDPTPKALELWPRIHEALNTLNQTIQPQTFEPGSDAMQFRIAMVDITVSLLASQLHASVHRLAPQTRLFFMPHGPKHSGAELMRGDLDFSIGIDPPRASVIQTIQLWSDTFVVAGRHRHPLLRKSISIEDFCAAPQLAINEPGDVEAANMVDLALEDRGIRRNVVMTVNQFVVVPEILQASDLVTVIPARFALSPRLRKVLSCQAVPFDIGNATVYLSWHQRNNQSAPHLWMRQQIKQASMTVAEAARPV